MLELPARDEAVSRGAAGIATATIPSMPGDPLPDEPPRDVAESMLELRDEVIGIQAQLDELRARVDELARSERPARRRLARVRARVTGASSPRGSVPS